MMRVRTVVALLVLVTLTGACRRRAERREVTIVTTPDVADTAVVEVLAAAFEVQRQSATRLVVTEERFIPSLVQRRLVDVVVTTSPDLQQRLRSSGRVHLANTFATEQFVIVGPRGDPAGVRDAPSPGEAFRRIARRNGAFCSAIDVPDLREREAMIRASSRARPPEGRRYRRCRGDAERVLREAARRSAYTLTDRATFAALRKEVELEILVEGDGELTDRYTVVLVARPSRNRNALWFVQWVMSVRARDVLAMHRFEGHRRLLVPGGE